MQRHESVSETLFPLARVGMDVGGLGLLILARRIDLNLVLFAMIFRKLHLTSVELFRYTLVTADLTIGVLLLLNAVRLAHEVAILWHDE